MEEVISSQILELEEEIQISENQIKQFRNDGAILLKQILSESCIKYFGEVIADAVIEKYNREEAYKKAPSDIYAKAFQQIENLWVWNKLICPFVFSKKFAKIATDLLGTSGVRLYHDQALFKEAGGGKTPWHADQYYWPLSNTKTCTIWVPLQKTPIEMGPISFAKGSHLKKFGRDIPISAESEEVISHGVRDIPRIDQAFGIGDVSFHYGYTLHHAEANRTNQMRKVMTVIYMDQDVKLIEPKNKNQEYDRDSFIPGVEVGKTCDSKLNPILYTTDKLYC